MWVASWDMEGVAEIPPGPALGATLAQIDPSRLCGSDKVEVLCAQHRQLAHEQTRMLSAVMQGQPRHPDVVRALVTNQWHGAKWRFAVTDENGRLILAGATRRHPTLPTTRPGPGIRWTRPIIQREPPKD